MKIKSVEQVTACVVDYGTFISVAEKLAETMKTVYYYSPFEIEYQEIRDYSRGHGLDNVRKLDELFDEKIFPKIDLFIFPDIGYGSLQRHLRGLGKAVWGHLGATELELHRDLFLEVVAGTGLPVPGYKVLYGVSELADYLQTHEKKWIKLNRFRGNDDTWHHLSWETSADKVASYGVIFGGLREQVVFIAQDEIESDYEVGYDGWCIDGLFPSHSFQGHEKKNELYLGSFLADEELPEAVRVVNQAFAPVLAEYGYRGWWATEIRIGAEGSPYFIDPTPRMPGQTGEHQQETLTNFAEIIWLGANGIVVQPEAEYKYAAEATLHYDDKVKDPTIVDQWKSLRIPEDVSRWVKLYHYSKVDGVHHFGARNTDEVGVVLGAGDSLRGSIRDLKAHLGELKELPVHAETGDFVDLFKAIEKAQSNGIFFGDTQIPSPESIAEDD